MGVADTVKQMCREKSREEGIEKGRDKIIRTLYSKGSSKEFLMKNLNIDMQTLDEILNSKD